MTTAPICVVLARRIVTRQTLPGACTSRQCTPTIRLPVGSASSLHHSLSCCSRSKSAPITRRLHAHKSQMRREEMNTVVATHRPIPSLALVRPSFVSGHFSLYLLYSSYTRLTALCPGLPGRAGTRKVKPVWILLKQETDWQWHQLGRIQVCTSLQTDNPTT